MRGRLGPGALRQAGSSAIGGVSCQATATSAANCAAAAIPTAAPSHQHTHPRCRRCPRRRARQTQSWRRGRSRRWGRLPDSAGCRLHRCKVRQGVKGWEGQGMGRKAQVVRERCAQGAHGTWSGNECEPAGCIVAILLWCSTHAAPPHPSAAPRPGSWAPATSGRQRHARTCTTAHARRVCEAVTSAGLSLIKCRHKARALVSHRNEVRHCGGRHGARTASPHPARQLTARRRCST